MSLIVSVIAIILSMLSIVFSIYQFVSETKRSRKEATIHAFDKLEDDVFFKEDYDTITKRIKQDPLT